MRKGKKMLSPVTPNSMPTTRAMPLSLMAYRRGTSFGSFLGRQSKAFLKAMDMDFIWLSNGFGFGNFAWCFTGVLFDDEKFMPEKAQEVKAQMIEFWTGFREACRVPVMVRGSNLSAGRDLAADGVPLREIYDIGQLVAPPVNSPWGALNFDFGSELSGWMSHGAGFPQDNLMFRYYVNDPWFPTKPYLLHYRKQPYDIYMPLAVSRINSDGKIITPSHMNIVTIDDCCGDLPREATESLIPHINQALRDTPDAPGPFVWLYPFEEYHNWVFTSQHRNDEVFASDLFIRDAINNGLPLNTVLSTKDCSQLPSGKIIISPVPQADSRWEDLLLSFFNNGGKVMLYGSLEHASQTLIDMLGIKLEIPLSGKFDIASDYLPEYFTDKPEIYHNPLYSGGGIVEQGGTEVLAGASSGNNERTIAAEASNGAGKLIWLRSSAFRCHAFSMSDEFSALIERGRYIEPAAVMLTLLRRFGWSFDYRRQMNNGWNPVNTLSMHDNAFFLSGYNFTTCTEHCLGTPYGAPALMGQDFILEEKYRKISL